MISVISGQKHFISCLICQNMALMYAVRFMSKLVVTILEQNVRVRRREQLTCRANGLKKTLQQIIEHTEKRKATVSISFLLQL